MIKELNSWLAGKPESVITALLLLLSSLGFLVALFGDPALKLFVTAYFLFP